MLVTTLKSAQYKRILFPSKEGIRLECDIYFGVWVDILWSFFDDRDHNELDRSDNIGTSNKPASYH